MPKRTTTAKAADQPWRRASAGSYRSSDERFEIQSEGAGRWFLVDEQEHDELGLPRTLGPFATLDAAKEGAEAQRVRPIEASPLAERLAEAAARPKSEPAPREAKPASRVSGSAKPERPAKAAKPGGAEAARPKAANPRSPAPPAKPPKPKTWVETLAEHDAKAAARARTMITALVVEGATPAAADEVVRRELVDGTPAVAEERLARAVAAAIEQASDRRRVARIAANLGPAADPAAAAADLARLVAEDLVERLAAVLQAGGGHHAALPGWELVERPAGRSEDTAGEPPRALRLRAASRRDRPQE